MRNKTYHIVFYRCDFITEEKKKTLCGQFDYKCKTYTQAFNRAKEMANYDKKLRAKACNYFIIYELIKATQL